MLGTLKHPQEQEDLAPTATAAYSPSDVWAKFFLKERYSGSGCCFTAWKRLLFSASFCLSYWLTGVAAVVRDTMPAKASAIAP